jgi:hypothetical protein
VILPSEVAMGAVTRRKVENREDAERLLRGWEVSKREFRTFCASRGVDGRSLRWWKRHLREEGEGGVQLVELAVTDPPSSARAMYRVVVGEVAVEVDDGFREDTLLRLLGVVSRC